MLRFQVTFSRYALYLESIMTIVDIDYSFQRSYPPYLYSHKNLATLMLAGSKSHGSQSTHSSQETKGAIVEMRHVEPGTNRVWKLVA